MTPSRLRANRTAARTRDHVAARRERIEVQDLKEALRAYLRGESAFEPVRTALDTALAALPAERRGDVEKLLKAAHSAGLQDTDFVALASRARAYTEQSSRDEPVEQVHPDFLSTVVLPKTPVAEPKPAADDAPGSEFLETVVLPGGAADTTRATLDTCCSFYCFNRYGCYCDSCADNLLR